MPVTEEKAASGSGIRMPKMTTGGSKAGSKANDIPASQLKGPFYMIENGDCKQVAVVKQL